MRLFSLAALSLTLTIAACDGPKPAAESPSPVPPMVAQPDSSLAAVSDSAAMMPHTPTASPSAAPTQPAPTASARPAPRATTAPSNRPSPRPSIGSKSPTDPDGGPVSRPMEDVGILTATGRIESIGSAPTNRLALVTPTGMTYRLTGAAVGPLWQRQGQTLTLSGRLDTAAPELTLEVTAVRP